MCDGPREASDRVGPEASPREDRLPVAALGVHLDAGAEFSLDEARAAFPHLTDEQARMALAFEAGRARGRIERPSQEVTLAGRMRDLLDEWEHDAAPYVCPGCYAVGAERCAPGCPDDEPEPDSGDFEVDPDDEDDLW